MYSLDPKDTLNRNYILLCRVQHVADDVTLMLLPSALVDTGSPETSAIDTQPSDILTNSLLPRSAFLEEFPPLLLTGVVGILPFAFGDVSVCVLTSLVGVVGILVPKSSKRTFVCK